MKKLLLVFLLVISYSSAYSIEPLEQLKSFSIPQYDTVEEYMPFEGKIITYVPTTNQYNKKMTEKFGTDYTRKFLVEKIKKGRKQKWPEVTRMNRTLVDVATLKKEDIVIYIGEKNILDEKYNDIEWDDEVRIYDLPFYNFTGRYKATLTKVEKPENPEIQYGEVKIVTDSLSKYGYVDNVLDIIISANSTEFDFVLKNKSEHSLKLLWDDASFVGVDGTTSKVMHKGVKYSERENSIPPSTIIRNASLEDLALPTSNVYYSNYYQSWIEKSIYPIMPFETHQIMLMLPIQIKGVTNEYLFIFDLNYEYQATL